MRVFNYIVLIMAITTAASYSAELVGKGSDTVIPAKGIIQAIVYAAKKYNVDANDLVKIGYIESRLKAGAERVNTNGTVDVGPFQINSVHWSTTCVKYDVLTVRGNALCAAKLLASHKKHKATDKAWRGRYHSKTPKLKYKYANMIASVDIK